MSEEDYANAAYKGKQGNGRIEQSASPVLTFVFPVESARTATDSVFGDEYHSLLALPSILGSSSDHHVVHLLPEHCCLESMHPL